MQPSCAYGFACDQVVGDDANIYCLCQGLNDGSLMTGCDECEGWFHHRCVGVERELGEEEVRVTHLLFTPSRGRGLARLT